MGAENSDSNEIYNRPNFQRRNSAQLNQAPNLPSLRRHENGLKKDKLQPTSLPNNIGFDPKNAGPQRFTRRASQNYCIDFRTQYSNGGYQNAVLRKFSDSIQNA